MISFKVRDDDARHPRHLAKIEGLSISKFIRWSSAGAGTIAAVEKTLCKFTGRFPDWCAGPSETTDAHLLELANAHGTELATLDQRIPGAFLLPLP